MPNKRVFTTHDNGRRPFIVTIDLKRFTVNVSFNKKVILKNIKPEHVHVGVDETKPNENNLGNSVLLRLKDNRYMFIGDSIYEFTTHAQIFKFDSPIGNNDVPYPWAIDKMGYVYLFNEKVVLSPNERQVDFLYFLQNPSPFITYYYKNSVMLTHNVEYIAEEGTKQAIHLSYEPDANKMYKRLNPIFVNGKKLSKAELTKIIKDFGKKMGYAPFKNVTVIQPRD